MCSEGKIKQTSFSAKETARQVRALFPLKNGAQASISQLKDRCMNEVFKTCQHNKPFHFTVMPEERKQFFVLTVHLRNEKLCFIFRHGNKNLLGATQITRLIKELKRSRWDILRRAWLVVYNDKMYNIEPTRLFCPNAEVFVCAVRHNISVAAACLIVNETLP